MLPLLVVAVVLSSALFAFVWLPLELRLFRKATRGMAGTRDLLFHAIEQIIVRVLMLTFASALVAGVGCATIPFTGLKWQGIIPAVIGGTVFEGSAVFGARSRLTGLLLVTPNILWIWLIGTALTRMQNNSLNRLSRRQAGETQRRFLPERVVSVRRNDRAATFSAAVVFLVVSISVVFF